MIARKVYLSFIFEIINAIIGWISLWYIARCWGDFAKVALGIIAFAYSFLNIPYMICAFFDGAHVKRISEGKNISTCLGTYFTTKILLTSIFCGTIVLGIFIWKDILNRGFYDATTQTVIYIFIAYYVFYSLTQAYDQTFIATTQTAKHQIVNFTENVIRSLALILVVSFGARGISKIAPELGYDSITPKIIIPKILQPISEFVANHILGALAFTYIIGILAALYIGILLLRINIGRFSNEYFKSYLYFAAPAMLIGWITILYGNIDKIMIGFFFTAADVGIYFAAQKIMYFLRAIHYGFGVLAFPTVSKYHSENNKAKIINFIYDSDRWLSLIILAFIGFIIVYRYQVIDVLLSSVFAVYQTTTSLVFLLLFLYVGIFVSTRTSAIVGMGYIKLNLKLTIFGAVLGILLNFCLIPEFSPLKFVGIYSASGAACATFILILIMYFNYAYYCKELIAVKLFTPNILYHIFSMILTSSIFYFTIYYFVPTRWYHLTILLIFYLGTYIAFLYLMKEFTKKDFHFIVDILHLGKLKKYIRSEIKK